nr:unnamed protein product [Callosobruchus analis]
MEVKMSNGFIETFAVFYNFCSICGFPTVLIDKRRLKFSKLRMFYCFVMNVAFWVSVTVSLMKYGKAILALGEVSYVVDMLQNFVDNLFTVTFTLMNVMFHNRRSELMMDMAALHRDLENFCGQYRKLSFRKVIIGVICAESLKVVLHSAVAAYLLQKGQAGSMLWFPTICTFLNSIWTEIIFIEVCMYLHIVNAHLRYLNTRLSNILENKSALTLGGETYSKIIYQSQEILKRVSKVTEDLNGFFGMTNLGQIFIVFLNITIRIYKHFKVTQRRSFNLYYGIINSLLKCVCLCTLADGLTEQAKAAGRIICKIDTYELQVLREIEAFTLQVISYDYKIIAGGFLNFLSGITTVPTFNLSRCWGISDGFMLFKNPMEKFKTLTVIFSLTESSLKYVNSEAKTTADDGESVSESITNENRTQRELPQNEECEITSGSHNKMDINASNGFTQTIALMYNFCTICGIPTVVIDKRRVQMSKIRLFYCVSLIVVFYVSFWFACKTILGGISAFGQGDVSNVVGLISLFLGIGYISSCVTMNLLFYKNRANLILDMIAVHSDLEHFCANRSENRYRNVARVSICMAVSKIALQASIYVYSANKMAELSFLKLAAPLYCALFEVVWIEATFVEICFYLYILKSQLSYFNTTLKNALKSTNALPLGSENISNILYRLKPVHKKISKLTDDMNKCFGVISVGQFLDIFIEITIGLYNSWKSPNTMNDYCMLNSAVKGICLCILSDGVIEQVSSDCFYLTNN